MRRFFPMLLAIILSIFLAACGTNQENTDENTSGSENESREENQEESEDQEEADQEETIEDDPSSQEEGNMIRLMEQNMQFELQGKQTERTSFLQESTENDYSLYVIEGFTFTAEEPNKDQVYFDEDGEQFMRISTFPSDTETSFVENLAQQQMEAVNEDNVKAFESVEDMSLPSSTKGYQTFNENEEFITLIIPIDDHLKLVTINQKKDFGDAFFKMIETIE